MVCAQKRVVYAEPAWDVVHPEPVLGMVYPEAGYGVCTQDDAELANDHAIGQEDSLVCFPAAPYLGCPEPV